MTVMLANTKMIPIYWKRESRAAIDNGQGDGEKTIVEEGHELELREEYVSELIDHFGPAPYIVVLIGQWTSGYVNFLICCQNGTHKMIGRNMVQPYKLK